MPARPHPGMIVVAILGAIILWLPLIARAGIIQWSLTLSPPAPDVNRAIADPAELFAIAHTVFLRESPFALREGNTLIVDLLREFYFLPGQMINVDRITATQLDADLDTSVPSLEKQLRAPSSIGDFSFYSTAKSILKNSFIDEFLDSRPASRRASDTPRNPGSEEAWVSISSENLDIEAAIDSLHQEVDRETGTAPQPLVAIKDESFAIRESRDDSLIIRAMLFVMVHWKTILIIVAGVFLLIGFITFLIQYPQRKLNM